MEEKLFWIGILMGLHLFGSYWLKEKNKLEEANHLTRIWHSVFCGIAGFIVMVLISVSLDNRHNELSTNILFTARQIRHGIFGLIAAAAYSWIMWPRTLKEKAEENAEDKKKKELKPGEKEDKTLPVLKSDMEWSETVFSAVILASMVMYFFIQAFKIPSSSMESTFLVGDHLFVNKLVYGIHIPYTDIKLFKFIKPKRGDISIFRFPTEDPKEYQCGGSQYGRDFIKRIVAVPGDKIEIRDKKLFLNDVEQKDEKYAQHVDNQTIPRADTNMSQEEFQQYWVKRKIGQFFGESIRDNFGPVTLPEKTYFLIGDNRDRSCDSRYWGPVHEKYLKGKAWITYWPPNRIGFPD